MIRYSTFTFCLRAAEYTKRTVCFSPYSVFQFFLVLFFFFLFIQNYLLFKLYYIFFIDGRSDVSKKKWQNIHFVQNHLFYFQFFEKGNVKDDVLVCFWQNITNYIPRKVRKILLLNLKFLQELLFINWLKQNVAYYSRRIFQEIKADMAWQQSFQHKIWNELQQNFQNVHWILFFKNIKLNTKSNYSIIFIFFCKIEKLDEIKDTFLKDQIIWMIWVKSALASLFHGYLLRLVAFFHSFTVSHRRLSLHIDLNLSVFWIFIKVMILLETKSF